MEEVANVCFIKDSKAEETTKICLIAITIDGDSDTDSRTREREGTI